MTNGPDPVAAIQADAAKVEQTIKTVQGAEAKIVQHPNTWVANITTTAAAAVAAITIWHPGFREPVAVQAAIGSVAALGAILTQIAHFVSRRIVKK